MKLAAALAAASCLLGATRAQTLINPSITSPRMTPLIYKGCCRADGMTLLATYPSPSTTICQNACLRDPACVAAEMNNATGSNCYLYKGEKYTNLVAKCQPSPTTTCWFKEQPACTDAMTATCSATPRTSAYTCIAKDTTATPPKFQCALLDRCARLSNPANGRYLCQDTGDEYMDVYNFPDAAAATAANPTAGRTTSKGQCFFACNNGFTLPPTYNNQKLCGPSGTEPDMVVPTCTLTQPCVGDNNPCLNGGTCVSDSTKTGPDAYTCTCASGWAGRTCSYKDYCVVDATIKAKCGTNGTCRAMAPGTGLATKNTSCVCDPLSGYSGPFCNCKPSTNPCKHGVGSATMVNGACSWSCNCDGIPWYGQFCDQAPGLCSDPTYCKNGATCSMYPVNGVQTQNCECATGFSGTTCTTATTNPPCSAGGCQNGGTCIDIFNQFVCNCADNWGGPTCTAYDNVNDCATNPCKNGGKCSDKYQGVDCLCQTGYGGTYCQISQAGLDPCKPYTAKNGYTVTNASSPCLNSGTCKAQWSNDYYGYKCTCPTNVFGDRCEHVDTHNDCLDQPCCSQGGNCLDLFHDAICICNTGWQGPECDTRARDNCKLGFTNPLCLPGATPFRSHDKCLTAGPPPPPPKAAAAKKKKSGGHGGLIFFIFLVLLGGGFYYLYSNDKLPPAIANALPGGKSGTKAPLGGGGSLYEQADEAPL